MHPVLRGTPTIEPAVRMVWTNYYKVGLWREGGLVNRILHRVLKSRLSAVVSHLPISLSLALGGSREEPLQWPVSCLPVTRHRKRIENSDSTLGKWSFSLSDYGKMLPVCLFTPIIRGL